MKLTKLFAGVILAGVIAAGGCGCTPNEQSSGNDNEVVISSGNVGEVVISSGNVGEVVISSGDTVAEIEIEGFGTIKAELFPDIAPIGVKNFTMLAEQGFYEGKSIHRIIQEFMIQGGSLNGDGTGGDAAYSGEGSTAPDFGIEVNKNARHFYGALCYANALGRNTTQFYIVNSKEPQDLTSLSPDDIAATAEQAKSYKEQCEPDTQVYQYYENMEKQYSTLAEWLKNLTDDVKTKYMEQGGVFYLDGGYTVFGQVVEGFDVIDKISAVEVTENNTGEKSKPVEDILIKSVKVYTAE